MSQWQRFDYAKVASSTTIDGKPGFRPTSREDGSLKTRFYESGSLETRSVIRIPTQNWSWHSRLCSYRICSFFVKAQMRVMQANVKVVVGFFYAIKRTKMRKKTMSTPKILIINQRLDVTDWKYLTSSPWAASMLTCVDSTFESILEKQTNFRKLIKN